MTATFLLLGATGNLGPHFVDAILSQGHKLKLLLRNKSDSSAERTQKIESFKSKGAEIVNGDIDDLESVKKALEGVNVVISALGAGEITKQEKLIPLLKEYHQKTNQLKRFIPSEFGFYVTAIAEDAKPLFASKIQVEKVTQESGLPYTFVYNGLFLEWLWNVSGNLLVDDGNGIGATTALDDIANIAVKAALDDRLVNKNLAIVGQELNQNELFRIYESVNGKSNKERTHTTTQTLTKNFQESLSKGDIGAAFGSLLNRTLWSYGATLTPMKQNSLLAQKLYPDYKFTNVEAFFRKNKQ